MRVTVKILLIAIVAFLAAQVIPGVIAEEMPIKMIVAIALAVSNAVVLHPLVARLSIPFTLVTFGFFLICRNAFLVKFADHFIDGFTVNGWAPTLLFALVITLVSLFIDNVVFRQKSFN
jgi:putative membrane protein